MGAKENYRPRNSSMGLEAACEIACEIRLNDETKKCNARLEGNELIVRGQRRFKINLQKLLNLKVSGTWLHIEDKQQACSLKLGGKVAAEWYRQIRYPKSTLDKLGVKEGMKVCVIGLKDPDFLGQLESKGALVSNGRLRKNVNIVFVALRGSKDLTRMQNAKEAILPNGWIWGIWPKGKKEFGKMDVMRFGKEIELVDVKICSFSDVYSALKFMIPKSKRP